MVTRKDVALLAGVSVATVSNVFMGKLIVSPHKAELVKEAAHQLGYVPNHTASSLKTGKSRQIVAVLNEHTNPYHMEVIRGIEHFAAKRGYLVSVLLLGVQTDRRFAILASRQMDAVINMTTIAYPFDFVNILKKRGTVLVDFGEDLGPSMHISYSDAMRKMMQRISEYGHTKVGYVSTTDVLRLKIDERSVVFIQSRAEYGFDEDDGLLFCNEGDWNVSELAGYELGKRLLAKRKDVTAVFATNDLAALGVMRAATEAGLNVPKDLSVIGCDDIGIASLFTPSLTTIKLEKRQFGNDIAASVIAYIEGGKGASVTAVAEPVYRESLGKCRTT
jgi:DNA-binding LacI/PurR family transcriptional regulator